MDYEESKKKVWDKEYATGFGSHLKLSDARAHNEMLVEFMTSVARNKAILDVGCGEGLLVDFLHEWGRSIIWVSIFQMLHCKMPQSVRTQRPYLRKALLSLLILMAMPMPSYSTSVFIGFRSR